MDFLKKYFKIMPPRNDFSYDNFQPSDRFLIIVTLLSSALMFLMFTIRYVFDEQIVTSTYLIFLAGIILLLSPLSILILKKVQYFYYLLGIFVLSIITVRIWTTGGLKSASIIWYSIAPLFASFTLGVSATIFFTFLAIFGVWLTYIFSITHLIDVSNVTSDPITSTVYSICILVIAIISLYFEHEKRKYMKRIIYLQNTKHSDEKFIELGHMSGSIAHEIKNPLASIDAHIKALEKVLKQQQVGNEQIDTCIYGAQRNVKRIVEIIDSLKVFISKEKIESTPNPIQNIMRHLVDDFSMQFEKLNIQFSQENPAQQYYVNKFIAERTISNIIQNSIEAVKKLEEKDRWIKIKITKESGYDNIIISITDGGKGIDHNIAQQIFTPFFTTKQSGYGTGLGLGICKSLVDSIDGKLVYHKESENTEFIITLPIV